MTWDQNQVDSFVESYNWTNFEQKSCRMSTSTVPFEYFSSSPNQFVVQSDVLSHLLCGSS